MLEVGGMLSLLSGNNNILAESCLKKFSILVGKVWMKTNPEILKVGFAKGGVVPLNKNVIPEDKYEILAWECYQNLLVQPTPESTSDALSPCSSEAVPATQEMDCIPIPIPNSDAIVSRGE